MPATLHIYNPLHFHCGLCIDPTLLHKLINCNVYLSYYLIICVSNNHAAQTHKYAIYPNNLMCIYGGSMPHVKLLPLMVKPESLYTNDDDGDNHSDAGPQ